MHHIRIWSKGKNVCQSLEITLGKQTVTLNFQRSLIRSHCGLKCLSNFQAKFAWNVYLFICLFRRKSTVESAKYRTVGQCLIFRSTRDDDDDGKYLMTKSKQTSN